MRLLNIYNPLRIIICSSASENHRSKLYETLLDFYELESICFMNRSDFREDHGKRSIERLGLRGDVESISFGFSKKYYALSAASALFHFLEQDMGLLFSSGTIKFQIVPSDGILSLGNDSENNSSINSIYIYISILKIIILVEVWSFWTVMRGVS